MPRELPQQSLDIYLPSLSDMQEFAALCAAACFENDVLLLSGNLGSGKTEFARFFIQAVSDGRVTVASPTFPIVLEYETQKGLLRHFDLYRIKNYEEIFHIGLEDAMAQGVTLVEWPEIAAPLFPEESARLTIKNIPDNEGARAVRMLAPAHIDEHIRQYAKKGWLA